MRLRTAGPTPIAERSRHSGGRRAKSRLIGADVGSMPIRTLGVQIWVFSARQAPARGGDSWAADMGADGPLFG
jgi:hypothetical protein